MLHILTSHLKPLTPHPPTCFSVLPPVAASALLISCVRQASWRRAFVGAARQHPPSTIDACDTDIWPRGTSFPPPLQCISPGGCISLADQPCQAGLLEACFCGLRTAAPHLPRGFTRPTCHCSLHWTRGFACACPLVPSPLMHPLSHMASPAPHATPLAFIPF